MCVQQLQHLLKLVAKELLKATLYNSFTNATFLSLTAIVAAVV
jgi:hypothetical protein